MRCTTLIVLLLVLLCCTPAQARTTEMLDEQGELFTEALQSVGLDARDMRISNADLNLWGGDKYRCSLLSVLMDNPFMISPYTRTMSSGFLESDQDLNMLLVKTHAKSGHYVALNLIGDPLEEYRSRADMLGEDALAVALGELTGDASDTYRGSAFTEVPPELRSSVAVFLFTLEDSLEYREKGLVEPLTALGIDPLKAEQAVMDYLIAGPSGEDGEDDLEAVLLIERMIDAIDWELYNAGAALLCAAVSELTGVVSNPDEPLTGDFSYSVPTPLGMIALNGDGGTDSRGFTDYGREQHLLVVDLAGSDNYVDQAVTSWQYPVSVVVDAAGDDTYQAGYRHLTGAGSGLFGYAFLVDIAGNDDYLAPHASQGCGVFGTGVLWDRAGNDKYIGDQLVQGAGAFGCGLLADSAGDDVYQLYRGGQGYGYTMGVGILVDSTGNDVYRGLEEPKEKANGGPFGAERFIHFAQGAAYGRRSDYSDGHSWAGGFGALVDGAGDDEYHCEVYGQGTGYWYAIGILVDKGGDDYHHAGWYSLGGSPHFAVGIFQDDAGDDRYLLKQMQSIGNGRDFSIGWFEDSAGNDYYQGNIMTFGVGDINGLGVFWDKHGDDTYLAKGPSHGQSRIEGAGSLRDTMLTMGLFIDGGGDDRYLLIEGETSPTGLYNAIIEDISALTPLDFAGNGLIWHRETDQNVVPGALGVGLDAADTAPDDPGEG